MTMHAESTTAAAVGQKMFLSRGVGLLLALGLLSAALVPVSGVEPVSAEEDPVIIRVGTHAVTRSEFEAGFARFARDTTLTEEENRKLYRGSVADRYLLIEEARETGFFAENPQIDEMLRNFEDYVITDKIRDQEVRSKVVITEEMVREFYDHHSVLYDIQQIIVPSEEMAREMLAQLRAGEDFADLARRYSVDAKSRLKGGQLKPFVYSATSIRFMEKLMALGPGEISEPIRSDYGYHVMRLNALVPRQQEPFEARREFMERQLNLRLQGEFQTEFYHSLRDRYGCQPNIEQAMELAAIYTHELDRAEVAEPLADMDHWAAVARSKLDLPDSLLTKTILTWRLGEEEDRYLVADNWRYINELPAAVLLDRRNPFQILSDGYSELHRLAMAHLAREQGIDQQPEVRAAVELKGEELCLTLFYQREILDKSVFTEADERAYYQEKRAKRFTHVKAIRLARVRYQRREAAAEAEKALTAGGAELEALIERHDQENLIVTQEPDTGWIIEETDPLLFERAAELEAGDVARYIDPDGYWTVFRILEISEAEVETFDEARETIQQDLRVTRSEEVLNDFLTVLREKHLVWIDPAEESR